MSKATKWITFWSLSIILGTIYGIYIGLDGPFDSKRAIGSELLERKKHKYFKQYQILEVYACWFLHLESLMLLIGASLGANKDCSYNKHYLLPSIIIF